MRYQVLKAASMNMSRGMLRRLVWYNFADVSEVHFVFTVRAVCIIHAAAVIAEMNCVNA